VELFFVMILVPFTMNSLQYWLQDNFLKGTEFIQDQQKQGVENRHEMK